ncbi:MAG: hypothetical protein K8R10_15745, partial [Rhodocyclales bacterium]|nr:hypothetical protein [Rhodocyclales bacterium]
MDIGKRGTEMKAVAWLRILAVGVLPFSLCIAGVGAAWADFEAGRKAMRAGDHATALREFQMAAARGEGRAQNDLGVLFERGWGVKQDFFAAASWYRKAADQGYLQAQTNLGYLHETGQG